MPFSGLTNRVWLWSVLCDSCTCTLTRGLPSALSSPLRSHLPMTRWPGPCEEAPLGTVLGRASHPWVGYGVSVLLGSRGCLGPIWMRCLLCQPWQGNCPWKSGVSMHNSWLNLGNRSIEPVFSLLCILTFLWIYVTYTQRIISEYCVLFSWFICLFIPVPHHLDYLVIGFEIERSPSSFFKSFAICSLNSYVTFTMFYAASTKIAMAVLIMS